MQTELLLYVHTQKNPLFASLSGDQESRHVQTDSALCAFGLPWLQTSGGKKYLETFENMQRFKNTVDAVKADAGKRKHKDYCAPTLLKLPFWLATLSSFRGGAKCLFKRYVVGSLSICKGQDVG